MRTLSSTLLIALLSVLPGCAESGQHGGNPPDSPVAEASSTPHPIFAYVGTSGKGEAEIGTSVIAFRMDAPTGKLVRAQVVAFHNPYEPGEVVVNRAGSIAFVVNLNSNELSAYSIDATTGRLALLPGAPTAGKGLTAVAVAPSGDFVYAADSLFSDRDSVYAYRVDRGLARMSVVNGSPFLAATGPVDIEVDPTGRFAYVVNQGSANISSYSIDSATGALRAVPGSSPTAGNSPWSIAFDPAGKYAFVIGYSGIFVFSIDPASGALTLKPGSPILAKYRPVSITFDEGGTHAFVVERDLGISTSAFDERTGTLTRLSEIGPSKGNSLNCLSSVDGYVFALSRSTSTGASSLSTYTEDAKTGRLDPIANSTVPAGDNAGCVVAVQRR